MVNLNIKPKRLRRVSEYGRQLAEKQKLRQFYGIREKQFKKYFLEAQQLGGVVGDEFIKRLEKRLDNAVYRLGFAVSREAARQLISHGHIVVNNRKITIPSLKVRTGDMISIREGSKNKKIFTELNLVKYEAPSWLTLDKKKIEGKVASEPKPDEIGFPIDIKLIVEFYSR